MLHDHRGAPVTGAGATALRLYEQAIGELNCYVGDPVATIDRAIAESPDFAMAHAMRAYLMLAGTEKDLLPEAAASLARMRPLALNGRERAHAEAADAFAQGELHEASQRLAAIASEDPHDIVSLQFGHLLDFFNGDARTLRDRVGRALPEWTPDLPGYHAVLGMHAFGLEECGDYASAESAGRRAVELNPRDGWAHHAVAHVMEMTGRAEEGADWLTRGAEDWAPESFFAVHNWWHLALFRLEHDDVAGALALYDGAVRGGRSGVVLEMIDASALLWRLHLRGVDVTERWKALAERWRPRLADGFYAFNDAHALMALIGAGDREASRRLLRTMREAGRQPGTNGMMTREVGLPLAEALVAFDEGRYAAAADALGPLRLVAARFGGSHAQRDLIDLTLMEASARAGRLSWSRALANERLQHKPMSPLARRYRELARPKAAA